MKTIEDDKFVSLNDVSAVDENRFYVTNDNGYTRDHWMFFVSVVIPRFSKSSVVFWDGFSSHYAVAPGEIQFANGIAYHHDISKLFVSATANPGILHIYDIAALNHPENLIEIKQVIVSTGIDNLSISPDDGSLWAACHPNSFRFLYHATNPKKTSPSQVLRFDISDLNNISIAQKYISDGDDVSASATGLSLGNFLVITPVFSDHFLLCWRN